MSSDPRLDCEDAFQVIEGGMVTLRLLWDQVAHSPSVINGDRLQCALHYTLSPMEEALEELERKLGLGAGESELEEMERISETTSD